MFFCLVGILSSIGSGFSPFMELAVERKSVSSFNSKVVSQGDDYKRESCENDVWRGVMWRIKVTLNLSVLSVEVEVILRADLGHWLSGLPGETVSMVGNVFMSFHVFARINFASFAEGRCAKMSFFVVFDRSCSAKQMGACLFKNYLRICWVYCLESS